MSHRLSQLVFLAITALLFGRVMVAQISAVEGIVKGQDGAVLSGAVIRIDRVDINGRYQAKTDKKGHFFYNGLPLGTYRVTCNVNGKDVDAVEVRTQLGDPIQVDFDVGAAARKEEKPQNSPEQSLALGTVYLNAQDASDRLQLNTSNGSFSLQEGGQTFSGSYSVAGSTLKLHIAQLQKDVDILVQGNELVVNGQEIWTQPNAGAELADPQVNAAAAKTGAEFDAGMARGIESRGKAIEVNPADARTHSNLAIELGKAKKFPEMEAETLKAAQLDPSKAGQYYFNMGAMLVIAGQSEQAAAAFRKAIEADPKHADSYYQLGVYLTSKASFAADGKVMPVPGTVEAFQKYLELAPMGQFADDAKAMLKVMNAK